MPKDDEFDAIVKNLLQEEGFQVPSSKVTRLKKPRPSLRQRWHALVARCEERWDLRRAGLL